MTSPLPRGWGHSRWFAEFVFATQRDARTSIPKWCSATCRHRAWEQKRAAASGRSAVQIVERRVEVPTTVPLTRRDWPRVLRDLTTRLDDGRVDDRDLGALGRELRGVLEAYMRRQNISGGRDPT
jgi:hypothetical protein